MKTLVWDIECTNLRSDIGILTIAVFGELDDNDNIKKYHIYDINEAGSEKKLVKWVANQIENSDIIIGHNSVSFDRNFINGVLARHNLPRLPKRQHLDTMMIARYGGKFLYQSVSMENLADILLKDKKDKPSKHDWREGNILNEKSIKRLRTRCKEDVRITASLFKKLKPYWHEWRGSR